MKAATMKFPLVLILSHFVLQLPLVRSQCTANCPCSQATCCYLIDENRPSGTVVGTFNETRGPYEWINPTMEFSINTTTGIITTTKILDRESTSVQQLQDDCFDLPLRANGEPYGLVYIHVVDVNDNPPVFTMPSYTVEVPESNGESLTPASCDNLQNNIVVMDADEEINRFIYKIEDSDLFILSSNSSPPCIQGRGLDADISPTTYSFILIAEDAANSSLRSTTNVTYSLININDNTPYFVGLDANITVREDTSPGDVVYSFKACDKDSGTYGKEGIVYTLESSNVPFEINSTSGDVTLTGDIDAEGSITKYVLEVRASDNGGVMSNFNQTSLTVFIGDANEPGEVRIFPMYVSVAENVSLEQIASIIITDHDATEENRRNENITLISSDPDRFYVVPSMNNPMGNIFFYSIRVNGVFDREEEDTVTLVVNVTQGGDPTIYCDETITVTVLDINDNPPILNISILTATEGQSYRINLSDYTYDKDNGTNGTISSYQLIMASGAGNQNFTDKFKSYLMPSGELIIPASELDREEVGSMVFLVINITDAGNPPMWESYPITLNVIDINDNAPTFSLPRYMFNVSEKSPVGTLVGQVLASDQDDGSGGKVVYMFSQDTSNFSIDANSGYISTGIVFDREESSSSSLTVVAADSATVDSMNSSVTVTIMILDVNDNDPEFGDMGGTGALFEITVSKRVGELVGQVEATDKDSAKENKVIIYQIEGQNDRFAISNNASGKITLKEPVSEPGSFMFTVSAFNPGREQNKSMILVTVVVKPDGLSTTLVIVVSATGSFFLVLIVVVVLLLIFIIWKNKKSKRQLKLHQDEQPDTQVSILKIPAAPNGTAGKSSRVTFKERVEETHYDGESSVINSTTSTIKKESVTKFDGSPQVLREEELVSPTSLSPVSSNGKPSQLSSGIAVVELEMSPRQPMNGDINGRCQFDVLSRSPILHIPNAAGARGHAAEMLEYSQGTSSDGHISVHDMDDESMYSDDASIVNTALSRFASNRPGMGISSYETASSHPHMELHRHLPPISHNQNPHSHSSSLAQLHAYNLAQLAKTNSTESRPHYSPMLSPDQDLTPTDDTIHHTTISTQSSIHTPTASAMNHMGMSANSKHQHMNGRQNFAHPLVMPDAFPRDPPGVHRFPMDSFGDYGEASTYASTELDEALGFNEAEPGIISLTATDYDDDTQL